MMAKINQPSPDPQSPISVRAKSIDSKSPWTESASACPSVVIDIPNTEPHAALLSPRMRAQGKCQCRVRRVEGGAELFLEDGNVFMLSAKRSGKADWVLFTEHSRSAHSAIARLCARKEGGFTLVRQRGGKVCAEEMLHVTHDHHRYGDDYPPLSTMTVTIPNCESPEVELPAGVLSASAMSSRRNDEASLPPHRLTSKLPCWVAAQQSWELPFEHGRCTLASSRNFQLQELKATANLNVRRASASEGRRPSSRQDHEDDTMATVLLYGKVDQQEFTMDYQQPLSTVQAFAACLSSWAW